MEPGPHGPPVLSLRRGLGHQTGQEPGGARAPSPPRAPLPAPRAPAVGPAHWASAPRPPRHCGPGASHGGRGSPKPHISRGRPAS